MIENLTETIHGTLLCVFGVGVLIRSESGTGKSECALEMVSRGHALVADDAVELTRIGSTLYGSAPLALAGLLQIREIGICDIRALYGEASVVDRCDIGVNIHLKPNENGDASTRMGGEKLEVEIMGVRLPHFVISNSNKRPLPVIIESAVKMMKAGGESVEMDLIDRYNKSIAS